MIWSAKKLIETCDKRSKNCWIPLGRVIFLKKSAVKTLELVIAPACTSAYAGSEWFLTTHAWEAAFDRKQIENLHYVTNWNEAENLKEIGGNERHNHNESFRTWRVVMTLWSWGSPTTTCRNFVAPKSSLTLIRCEKSAVFLVPTTLISLVHQIRMKRYT